MILINTFKSLADEIRLRILRVLQNGSFNVNELLFVLQSKQSNISHHLKILQESGFVTSKKEGAQVYYSYNYANDSYTYSTIREIIRKNSDTIPQAEEDRNRFNLLVERRRKRAEDFFNTIGEEYDKAQDELFGKIYSVSNLLKLFTRRVIVADIGCGTGKNLPLLQNITDKVYGIDLSPKMINLAEHICLKNKLNYAVYTCDAINLPLNNGEVDGVFMNMFLHHVSTPIKMIEEIYRVLSDKGEFLFIDLLTHDKEFMLEKFMDLRMGFDESELDKIFLSKGFMIKYKELKRNENEGLTVAIYLLTKN